MSDVDDLGLGLSDEEEVVDNIGVDENGEGRSQDNDNNDDGSENNEGDEVDLENDDSEEKLLSLSIPRHGVNDETEADTYGLKLPLFLNVEAHPFDAVDFKETIEYNAEQRKKLVDSANIKNELIKERLSNQNTIRWRYVNENEEIIKQSNAHFIQWDNGLISLKIGDEIFDIKQNNNYDNLLVRSHDDFEILQADAILNHSISLLPASTKTSTHRQLTNAVKMVQKKDRILNTITTSDPLEVQRLADETDRKAMKLKRQLDLKRRLQEERLGSRAGGDLGDDDDEQGPTYERFERDYDGYDEEDDFIDDDDDDIEEGAERLNKLKKAGASKYEDDEEDEVDQDVDADANDVDDEDDKEDNGNDDEENRRKRRRIIDSDDEE